MNEVALYIVPTPIGNLEDITLRAINTLKKVNYILAEDTRRTNLLLKHLGIKKPLKSYHSFNEKHSIKSILLQLMNEEKIALVCDSGMPLISDPGLLLVRACIEKQLKIECLPGPTAFVPALIQSGFSASRFVFEGFLPVKRKRRKYIESFLKEERTIILYESPHRLLRTLHQMIEVLGEKRKSVVCREISKKFEEVRRGTLLDLYTSFQKGKPKGECVILLAGEK